MKMKKIFLLLLLTAIFYESSACNTCGCGVANYHYGILPQFQENFVGLRYRYRTYDSRLDAGHLAPYSYERFQSTELWGRFYPMERLQLFAFVPYNFNKRIEGEKVTHLEGLGDIVVSANYSLINTYDTEKASGWTHNLLVGAGLKFPTGKFRALEDGMTINQNFQLGTGSVDYLFNVLYTLRHANLGVNTEFSYQFNNTNADEYRFGNTSKSALTAFFIPETGALTLMPNAGIGLETFKDNRQFDQPFPDTGGWALLYSAGVEAYFRSVAMGVTYTHPGRQELFSGKVMANSRVSMHLTFML